MTDPIAKLLVHSLVDAIGALLDAPALRTPEALGGEDVRAVEAAKAAADAAVQFYPLTEAEAAAYRPTAAGLNLILGLLAAAVDEAGPAGVANADLYRAFARYGGSRELFDAMMKTLESSNRVRATAGPAMGWRRR